MYISNVESHSHSITVCPYIREKIVIYLQKEKRFILVFKYLKRIGVKKFSYQNQLEELWRFESLQTFREIAFQFLYALHITNACLVTDPRCLARHDWTGTHAVTWYYPFWSILNCMASKHIISGEGNTISFTLTHDFLSSCRGI